MAVPDPDNCIKLFKLDDSQDVASPENVAIIPVGKNIFQSMFHSEFKVHQSIEIDPTENTFPEDGVDLLVKFRHELEELFQDCGDILGIAAVLWEDISRRLFDRGFTVTGKQCSTKWEMLYSEYLQIAQSDDEGRASEWKNFAAFEHLYKIRSKYIDSKILEDITEYLNSRFDYPSAAANPSADTAASTDQRTESCNIKFSGKELSRENFSTLNNEEDNQMLTAAINAAEEILEENSRRSDVEGIDGFEPNVGNLKEKEKLIKNSIDEIEQKAWDLEEKEEFMKTSCLGYEEFQKQGENTNREQGDSSMASEQEKITDVSQGKNPPTTTYHLTEEKEGEDGSEYQAFVRSEKTDFYWDADATQCFLDLRLYVETNRETKQSITRKYKTIAWFVSQKMFLSGYKVSEMDCQRKWDQLLRYYNKEAMKLKKKGIGDHNRLQGVRKYFLQMDKVLRKFGVQQSGDGDWNFCWDEYSIRKLIEIRIPMDRAFAMFKKYGILWQYIASQMKKNHCGPTYNECSIKWMELCEIYELCLQYVKKGTKEDDINWIFYKDMRQGFERNAKGAQAIINYDCNTGLNVEETSHQSSAPPISSSESKILAEIKLDALQGIANSAEENTPNSQTLESDVSQNTLEVAIQHCTLLEHAINETDLKITNEVVKKPQVTDIPVIDNGIKILTLKDLYSLDNNNNWLVKLARPDNVNIEVPRVPLQKSRDTFEVINQFEQSCSGVGTLAPEEVNNVSKEMLVWTEEATVLLIKCKISRELKFRSPSFIDIDLWKEIAIDMQSVGHNVSHESCATRWHQLIDAFKGNSVQKNHEIICPKYREQLKLVELPFTTNTSTAKLQKSKVKANCIDCNGPKFVWTDEAVRRLLELRFSTKIRHLKKYGLPIAEGMQAAGFANVRAINVTKKWSRMFHTYRRAFFRKETGQNVKWEYFELIDKYMKNSMSGKESEPQDKEPPFLWTPAAIQKLMDLRLSLKNLCYTTDHKTLSVLWKRIAGLMLEAGFQVTSKECAMEWNFLIQSYTKTVKELRSGNGAVIGQYFMMVDKALNKLKKSIDTTEDIEEPIDYSITKTKKKIDDSCVQNMGNIDQSCCTVSSNGYVNGTPSNRISENEKRYKSVCHIVDNAMNLNLNIVGPALNCSPINSSIGIEKLPKNNICNSIRGSSYVSGRNKEKKASPIMKSTSDGGQQKVSVCLHKENCNLTDNKMMENNDYVDSSKENVVCMGEEIRYKTLCTTSAGKREDIQSRILCSQKPCNKILNGDKAKNNLQSRSSVLNSHVSAQCRKQILVQSRAVNLMKARVREEMDERWSEASTCLLIDLKQQHIQKFYRSETQWEKVSTQLASVGYNYTSQECKEKWHSLKNTYEHMVADIKAKKSVQHWPHFEIMDSLYRRPQNIFNSFRFILPKKRLCENEGEHLVSNKKLAV